MKRRIRIGEFLIEKAIATIAFGSLGAIVLIFLFVFREAVPIFTMDARALSGGHESISSSGSTDSAKATGESESYGDPVGESESYGDPEPVGAAESYGEPETIGAPEAYGEPETVGAAESYGDSTTEAPAKDTSLPASASMLGKPPPPSESAAPDEGASILSQILSGNWQPVGDHPKFGILPLLAGSLKVALIAILIAAPVGIFAALFTSTFAPRWAKEAMKPIIEIMAGFPSVVIGFFALTILASLVQTVFGLDYRLNALVGGIAMSMAVIPLIYTISEDALSAVPKHFTEGSLALGAPLWETNLRVVLPAAIPGIFAGVLLGLGRAIGETMIVLMATGNAALLTPSFVEPVRTVSASIGAEMAEVVFGDPHYVMLFVLGSLLFCISFALNAVAEIFIRQRLMAKFGGAS
ncbi:MAG: phosphate ABC transporter permease subunit PstC [Fibrobacterota bacterium]|nr:MAG: phosphate ABC transporter permease subunit PstC [Fibrobacterota bacterium]